LTSCYDLAVGSDSPLRLAALVLLAPMLVAATPGPPPTATDGPGVLSHFGLAHKDCLGTAAGRASTAT
jgi:glucoamylase